MESSLRFLTNEDYALLREKSKSTSYHKNEEIIQEGFPCNSLFFVTKGIVRVEHMRLGKGVAIAFLQPGEIFGEMSFLEEVGASATIVAEEDVEVNFLDKNDIQSLLNSVPGLATRFYHSLAVDLSSRLRQTSALIPPLMAEVMPGNNLIDRSTQSTQETQIPLKYIQEIQQFKAHLLQVESDLLKDEKGEDEIQVIVSQTCNSLINTLQEQTNLYPQTAKAIGIYVLRETFAFFMLSSAINFLFRKAHNYASESYLLEILHQPPQGDRKLGIYIDRWFRSIRAVLSLKNRSEILRETISEIARGWIFNNPMPITNLASGSTAEILELFIDEQPYNIHATCIDMNNKKLAYAANLAQQMGLMEHLTFIQDSIILLSQGRSRLNLPPQQVVYSGNICNYLQDKEVIAVLNWIYDHLLPSGTIVLGNFASSNPDRAFMEQILEWQLYHRSEEDLRNLFAKSKFASLPIEIQYEEYGVQLFAVCTKTWE
jgi:CRP-like cAMP-binding protein